MLLEMLLPSFPLWLVLGWKLLALLLWPHLLQIKARNRKTLLNIFPYKRSTCFLWVLRLHTLNLPSMQQDCYAAPPTRRLWSPFI